MSIVVGLLVVLLVLYVHRCRSACSFVGVVGLFAMLLVLYVHCCRSACSVVGVVCSLL